MIYDDFGAQLKREYDLFLFALAGRYLSLMAPGAEVSPFMVRQLKEAGAALRETFLQLANQRVTDYVSTYASASAENRGKAFLNDLSGLTNQNVNSLTLKMKGAAKSALSSVQGAHGGIGLLLQRKLATPEFKVVMTSGRTFDAAPLVKSLARNFAYQTWIDHTLTEIGATSDLAQVQYADPAHAGFGQIFSISGNTAGYPSYDQIAAEVFHFNAQATIVSHVST
jgi:hypothetical protein